MSLPDSSTLQENTSYCENCGSSIWLMDDHRWALYAWDRAYQECQIDQFSLVHADYHWDAVNDFIEYPGEADALRGYTHEQLKLLIQSNERVKYDSFIAPAIIRGLLNEVHFFCLESEENGLDEDLVEQYSVKVFDYRDWRRLAECRLTSPHIFDLCLDLFNHSNDKMYEGDLWNADEINEFVNGMQDLIQEAEIVTVSLSFGYSGNCDQTRWLADLVLPKVWEFRN